MSKDILPELIQGLYSESSITAFFIGKILTALGRSDYTASAYRRDISEALMAAAQDFRSKRLIHFGYTDAILPQIQRLDTEFFKMAMKVSGLSLE